MDTNQPPQGGSSQTKSRYQRVKDILDAAAGNSTADYQGHGRFWNLPLSQFLEVEIYGIRMIAPAEEGDHCDRVMNDPDTDKPDRTSRQMTGGPTRGAWTAAGSGQPADGATILQTPTSILTIYPHIYKKLPYDPLVDLAPVTIACQFDFGFAVGPAVPASVKSVPEFLAWAKTNPAGANFGSPAAGSTPHFIGALLGKNVGVDLKHAAYRGTQPAMLDLLPTASDVYLDEVAHVVMPRWSEGRIVLLGDAAFAVSLFAGKGATLAMAGAVVLADALADGPDEIDAALAAYEARLRPWVETAQRMARRNIHLFAPANRFQLLAREAMLRLAARPFLVPLVRRLLNRQGERL